MRHVAAATLLALLLYGVVQLLTGIRWSLVPAAVIGIGLFLLARGGKSGVKLRTGPWIPCDLTIACHDSRYDCW